MDAHQSNSVIHYLSLMVGLFCGLNFNQWMTLITVIVMVCTLAVNFYFKKQHLKIARQKMRGNVDVEENYYE